MNIVDWFILISIVALCGGLPAVAVALYIDRKNETDRDALNARIDAISDRLSAVDSAVVRSSIALEGSFTETIRKVQAEIKSLEIVFRGSGQTTRENPESVDSAIRLAREGVSSDLIVAKTGLPVHAVESIISLHGRR